MALVFGASRGVFLDITLVPPPFGVPRTISATPLMVTSPRLLCSVV